MPNTTLIPPKYAIEIRNLNFFYGTFKGLKNIDLNIAEHQVTAFIGPSGCGKSTLLRTLNRMYSLYPGQRAEGEISFYGKNILDADQDLNLLRADAFSNVDLWKHRLWYSFIRKPVTLRHGRSRRMGFE